VLSPSHTASLRSALAAAGFTVDRVYAHLGDEAHRALARNQTVPALRATGGGSPLETLVRLFSLQVSVARAAADAALPALVEPLAAAGMLETSADEVRALVDVRPYGDEQHDWWVVCDLTPGLTGALGATRPDFVLGISEASSSLAQLTRREPVGRALDLGTGCGVQSLHLAQHAGAVVATDVNPRALRMARLTAALNGVDLDVRDGSLYEPVAGETFDLIATNPPFVISPPGGERLVYRDAGMPGDEVVRRVVTGAAEHLSPGGWCQVLANWAHVAGEPWSERLRGWIEPAGLDAWVLEREVADPATYVEMWLADQGLRTGTPEHTARYDAWLDYLAAQRVEGVGFGWLSLRKAGSDRPEVQVEEWTGEVAQPLAPAVSAWADAVDAVRGGDLLGTHWRVAPDVVQETYGPVGADDPEAIVLHKQTGVRRTRRLDTVAAGLVSTCDGDLAAGQILDALAQLLDHDAADLRSRYAPLVRDLVAEGFLTP
jgi:SAM-dependent methyltransferase